MNRKTTLLLLAVLTIAVPTHAFFGAIVEATNGARDAVYQKFMMLKAIQQLKALRDNYVASVRYYNYFKKLNEGRGLLANVARRVGDIGTETIRETHEQMKYDWLYDPAYHSDVDEFFRTQDRYIEGKILYAGEKFEAYVLDKEEGEKISAEADALNPKDLQKLQAKVEALQLQMSADINANLMQLIDLNARIYRLQMERDRREKTDWAVMVESLKRHETAVMRRKRERRERAERLKKRSRLWRKK